MKKLLLILFIIFSVETHAQTIKQNQSIMIDNLRILLNKVDRMDDKIGELSTRMSVLEAWKDDRQRRDEKLLERMEELVEDSSTSKGVVMAFLFFWSMLTFGFSTWLQYFLSKKKDAEQEIILERAIRVNK